MGTDAHVIITDGGVAELDHAQARIEELESRWSRFRDDSELNALNRADGNPAVVSRDTALLVEHCVRAWRRTGGAFDPTVFDAMVANGYDRDFAEVASGSATPTSRANDVAMSAPGLDGTVVDVEHGFVWLRRGVHLDPGAIGKGLAADVVCGELIAAGVAGACVNLGGDLRCDGRAPDGGRWSISIDHPIITERELVRIGLHGGGVATSSRLRRVWQRGADRVHHVVDPRTGRPFAGPTAGVTVIAPTAWQAEVWATRALLADDPLEGAVEHSVIAIDEAGGVRATPDLEGVLACSAA